MTRLPADNAAVRAAGVKRRSEPEEELAGVLRLARMPEPIREWVFHPTRKWRFDFAWPKYKVAVEVEGGVYVAGRHSRGSSFEADAAKYNEAALLGWIVLRVTPRQIRDGQALGWVRRALVRRAQALARQQEGPSGMSKISTQTQETR